MAGGMGKQELQEVSGICIALTSVVFAPLVN